jgi:GR25 family glycosyltransferase involved in LPS biosynthesis
MDKIKFYIAHYPKLKERKEYIENIFLKENIKDYIFVETLNKEDIDEKINQENFLSDEKEIRDRLKSFIHNGAINQFVSDKMNNAEKSLALKHKFAYKHFLENSNKKYFIFFEDDIRFAENFSRKINKLLEDIEYKNFDVLLFGAGTSVKNERDKTNFLNSSSRDFDYMFNKLYNHPFGRGCDSYLLTREAVNKLNFYFSQVKIVSPIDWELSYCGNFLKIFESFPYLTYQGSNSGEYQSSIRDRKNLYD